MSGAVPGAGDEQDHGAGSLRVLLRAVAAGALMSAGGLFLWSVVALPFGWTSQLVLTGSMEPRIHPGDVVLVQPRPADDVLLGRIALLRDPSGVHPRLLHRIVRRTEDGAYVSKGDANIGEDSTPVPAEDVLGLARVRVPFVGLPVVWLHEGRHGALAVLVLALTAALLVVLLDG
ncbi:signal peptidase I [Kineococcus glutinatus]|uniref:Signal peptidase I n=1 Tax=Kineococcus glutinatus TaxID=1070872 RepID=A0ABP9HUB3_9ACTN